MATRTASRKERSAGKQNPDLIRTATRDLDIAAVPVVPAWLAMGLDNAAVPVVPVRLAVLVACSSAR
jgi:hypothetical protein